MDRGDREVLRPDILDGFPGICRIHRAEVAAVGGEWERAEQELERATEGAGKFNARRPQAEGFYAIGDIRRLMGDLEGAEAALREAHARGRPPQPALALVRLAQGNAQGRGKGDRCGRRRRDSGPLGPGPTAARPGRDRHRGRRRDRARTAVDELAATVADYPSPALEAGRRVAQGRVLLAEGDRGRGPELRRAITAWRDVGAPYEIARARVRPVPGAPRRSRTRTTRTSSSTPRWRSSAKLGAKRRHRGAEREMRETSRRAATGPPTARMTFMFTDIVGSTQLAEAIGDDALGAAPALARRHARGRSWSAAAGEVVKSTGDGFFAAFESARAAIETAIAIQRALAITATSAASRLSVRIGIHTADANRRGADYSGKAVHVAARIGALAEGGEILASANTIAEAGEGLVAASITRPEPIRGVSTPVDGRRRSRGCSPMPRFIPPMLATLVAAPFDNPDWQFEVKWDGFRVEAIVDGDEVRIWTRGEQDAGRYFGSFLAPPSWIAAREAIVDGEVIALDDAW